MAQGQTSSLNVIHNFTGVSSATPPGDGAWPFAGLASDGAGNYYGTTWAGATSQCNCGTVFRMSQDQGGAWTETILHNFAGQSGNDGADPEGGVVIGPGGVLYGTTRFGGTNNAGTVFSLAPSLAPSGALDGSWTETVLYSFQSSSKKDGAYPFAGVIVGPNGELYGTTEAGGNSDQGSIFELVPPASPGGAWTESVLFSFWKPRGSYPFAPLVMDANGVLYGTTKGGGTVGAGVVFELAPPKAPGKPWRQSVIYSFSGTKDGRQPIAGLHWGPNGVLYGTTYFGGAHDDGVAFMLTPGTPPGSGWIESTLHVFDGSNGGGKPRAGLVVGANGVLYGATRYGGSTYAGIIFELVPPAAPGGAWQEVVLHVFGGPTDGEVLFNDLVIGPDGSLYGTASEGGSDNWGVIFQVTL